MHDRRKWSTKNSVDLCCYDDYVTKAEDENDQALINIDYCYEVMCSVLRTSKVSMNSPKPTTQSKQEEMNLLKENNIFRLMTQPDV